MLRSNHFVIEKMNIFSISVFLVATFLVSINGTKPELGIISGKNATQGEFPYAVSLRYNDCHECGGSIIHEKWILTAAHCIYPFAINLSTVLYGTLKADNCQVAPANTKKVKRAVVHQNFDADGGAHCNDIALVEVEEPFEFNKSVQPVLLPFPWEVPPVNALSTLVGWGYEKTNGSVPPILKKVDIYVFSDIACSFYHHENYTSQCHICAGVVEGGKGQCTGDSGGPLTHNGVQIGIVSWSDKPCASTPGILVRVSRYIWWIRTVTGLWNL